MKKFRKRQLYITLGYFIPAFIVISISTFFVLHIHKVIFEDIRNALIEESFDARVLLYNNLVGDVITEKDWSELSSAQIDAKLKKEGLNPIGNNKDPLYYLSPQEIDLLSKEDLADLFADDYKYKNSENIIGIDLIDDEKINPQYFNLDEYENLTERIYNETFWIIIIFSFLLMLLFGYLSYRMSLFVIKPIIQAYEQQQQFISDASHELRTPIAILQSEVDIVNRLKDITEKRHKQFISNVSTASFQLTHIIQQLMLLGRLDAKREISCASVNIINLLKDTIKQFTETAKKKNIILKWEGKKNKAMVLAEPGFLFQVLVIVMDNAIKYANENTEINICIFEEQKKFRLEIINKTDPIPNDQLSKVFERLYRVSKSRHDEGLGLGLAIAQTIMEKFKGSIGLKNIDGGVCTYLILEKTKK